MPNTHSRSSELAALVRMCIAIATVACATITTSAFAEDPASSLHSRIDSSIGALRAGPPSPIANDAEFVRRLYLDLTGMIPTADEARSFLDDTTPNKREAL